MSDTGFKLRLTQQQNFQFLVEFLDTEIPPITTDEPPPLGENAGPNPSRMLAAAVANCLAASLMFALKKFKNEPDPVTVEVDVEMVRNEAKRLRVGAVNVAIQLGKSGAQFEHLDRVLAQFEDFCVVTQSVRDGFDVNVAVRDSEGVLLKG
ncbi:OsmC family protein [Niveibacterium sp.]|uniref:OsmC family protein n=1 Tax=Niveibacterium sp. TaxID=2017444 RepID=UPI0035AF6779